MAEYIEREAAKNILLQHQHRFTCADEANGYGVVKWSEYVIYLSEAVNGIDAIPAADVRPVPEGGIGEMSDGYHTFNGLYYQRMVLFAALVKAYKDKAWKSWKHEDGELCFGGGWFIVGIDTPEGSYTYHYEDKDWDRFECEELPVARHWDGHTEEDVTRLLSLAVRPVVLCKDCDCWNEWDSAGRESLGNYVCSCAHWSVEDGPILYTRPTEFCSYGEKREES